MYYCTRKTTYHTPYITFYAYMQFPVPARSFSWRSRVPSPFLGGVGRALKLTLVFLGEMDPTSNMLNPTCMTGGRTQRRRNPHHRIERPRSETKDGRWRAQARRTVCTEPS